MSGKRKASVLDGDGEEVSIQRSKRQRILLSDKKEVSQVDAQPAEEEEVITQQTSDNRASELDPEYEDITAQQTKRQKNLELDGNSISI